MYDDDAGKLFDRHAALMDHFEKWRSRPRFTLYAGIDADDFFQRLLDRAIASRGPVGGDGQLVGARPSRSAPRIRRRSWTDSSESVRRNGRCLAISRTRLLAQLVDLEDALSPLSDTELEYVAR